LVGVLSRHLKQGSLSVSEYRDRFLQLSRYAPEDVNTDAKRQYRFLRGLVDPLQYQQMNHTFPTFQHLIDRAIMTERKCKEMEDRKRKISGPQPGSSNSPRFSGNQPQQFRKNQCPPQQQQFQRQYPQHQHQNRQNNQSGGGQFQRQNQQHLVFLPQRVSRTTKQHQLRLETEHVSTVGSKVIG
jgi:hypothetical protein